MALRRVRIDILPDEMRRFEPTVATMPSPAIEPSGAREIGISRDEENILLVVMQSPMGPHPPRDDVHEVLDTIPRFLPH